MNNNGWSIHDMKDEMVMVYQDPITKLDPEGEAILIEPIRYDIAGDLSLWLVQFNDEPEYNYQRTIDRKDIISG